MADIDDLLDLEPQVDALEAAAIAVEAPRRVWLTALYCTIHRLARGPMEDRDLHRADALIRRLPFAAGVLQASPPELVGESASNCVEVTFADPEAVRLLMGLISYTHACELFPELRKDRFAVERDPSNGQRFVLKNPGDDVAAIEAADTLLAEIAMAAVVRPVTDHEHFDAEAASLPLDVRDMIATVRPMYEQVIDHQFEATLVPESSWETAYGFDIEAFRRVRAALIAIAEYHLAMADALQRRLEAQPDQAEGVGAEWLEWQAPVLSEDFFVQFVSAVTGLPVGAVSSVLDPFYFQDDHPASRTAFFQPLQRLNAAVMFSPVVLQRFLAERNLLALVATMDPERFDNEVSSLLEARLLQDAQAVLEYLPGVELESNVAWIDGEVDLMALDRDAGALLIVEAKAPVPPQGARMVRHVETRCREGLEQIERFAGLSQGAKTKLLERVFGNAPDRVDVTYLLLSRTCFGSIDTWQTRGSTTFANLSMLTLATSKMIDEGLGVGHLADVVDRELDRHVADCVRGWVNRDLDLGVVKLELPTLELHLESVDAVRAHAQVTLRAFAGRRNG